MRRNNLLVTIVAILCFSNMSTTLAQTSDTTKIDLNEVTITSYVFPYHEVKQLDAVHHTYITSGKKNEVISLQHLPFNVSEKTGRQLFAKVPGAFIYDMDGSGNQLNVATRGLDPHRSWEYNIRQNDIMTNSDIYGYPASHYSPPMEAIQRIEVIRGTSSLQYGSQFGGLINYITKSPDTTKTLGLESLTSVGSYGLLSSYNAIGGKVGKLNYYAYYHKRVSDGYRDNARSDANAQFVQLTYFANESLLLKAELGRSTYVYQIPGPLTDVVFNQNPRQSTRKRNYFSPDIYLPSFSVHWKGGKNTVLNWTSSAVLGTRSSVQFIGNADVNDVLDTVTHQYKARQVDIDGFNSYASELRLQQNYNIGTFGNTVVAGLRYTNNDLHRRQQGKGTAGSDFDLSLTSPAYGRDIHFKTSNVAVFVENLFMVTKAFHLSAGMRWENGSSKMSGIISYLPGERVPQDIDHQYVLFGFSGQYQLNNSHKIYGGWSQAYRPVVFADIIPATILERTDADIKDAFGHNAELGIKGRFNARMVYDVTFFSLLYKNRIGSLILEDENGSTYAWKTNIGDSRTNGLEMYIECKILEKMHSGLSLFTASSWFDGQYLNGSIRNGNENTSLKGKKLETVPTWISRNGLQFTYRKFSSILQYSYVSSSYSDALNTETPSANGSKGIVPAYGLVDLNMAFRLSNSCQLRLGINNLTDESYFTKRPAGYPGQGVWSSDGRSIVATVALKI